MELYERSENINSRNGKKSKTIKSKYGESLIDVPQDREGTFEPKIVKKRQKDISGIEDKIISMYAKGIIKFILYIVVLYKKNTTYYFYML